ncbi:Stomatin [uncultured archaeon]|nr:Stomatin [uncultured archaeon]
MQSGEEFSRLGSLVILGLAVGSFFLFNSLFLAIVLGINAIALFLGFLPTYGQIHDHENVVIFRFGRYFTTKKPGIYWYYPRFDELIVIDMRSQVIEVHPVDYLTKDSLFAKVGCIYQVKVIDARNALIHVKDYKTAITATISSSLRKIIAELSFEELNASVESINKQLKTEVENVSKDWGLKVEKVEVSQIIPPASLIEALKNKREAAEKKLTLEIQARTKQVNLEVLNEIASKLDDKTLTFLYLETMKSMAEGRASKIYFPSELTQLVSKISGVLKSNSENK